MNTETASITVTHVHEHLHCPRFTYFECVLTVPERPERGRKVQRGREVHRWRQQVKRVLRTCRYRFGARRGLDYVFDGDRWLNHSSGVRAGIIILPLK